MGDGIPYRNHSPHGWWVASYILRATWDDETSPAPTDTFLVWKNTILLRASEREEAYEKALRLAEESQSEFEDGGSPERKGRWVLEGLTSLLPVYEKLEDGAEILWEEHKAVPPEKLRSWVKSKLELEVFDDTPAPGDAV